MRRRKPQFRTTSGDVPPELLVGHVLDVWADEEGPALAWSRVVSTRVNYRWARRIWQERAGLDPKETHKLIPSSSRPIDIAHLCDTGHEDIAERTLGRAGLSIKDLPALRQRALSWKGIAA